MNVVNKRISFKENCHFMIKKGIMLGHIVSSKGLKVDKEKVEYISKILIPKTVKHICLFLRRANFYRRFIQDFSNIVRPFSHLIM